jgi:hypothetical protein
MGAIGLNLIGVILVYFGIDTWSIEGLFLTAYVLLGFIPPAYGVFLLYNWLKPSSAFIISGLLLFVPLGIFVLYFIEKSLLWGTLFLLPFLAAICFTISGTILILIGVLLSREEPRRIGKEPPEEEKKAWFIRITSPGLVRPSRLVLIE